MYKFFAIILFGLLGCNDTERKVPDEVKIKSVTVLSEGNRIYHKNTELYIGTTHLSISKNSRGEYVPNVKIFFIDDNQADDKLANASKRNAKINQLKQIKEIQKVIIEHRSVFKLMIDLELWNEQKETILDIIVE